MCFALTRYKTVLETMLLRSSFSELSGKRASGLILSLAQIKLFYSSCRLFIICVDTSRPVVDGSALPLASASLIISRSLLSVPPTLENRLLRDQTKYFPFESCLLAL